MTAIAILLSTLVLATTAVMLTVFIQHGRDVKAIQCQHLHADSVEEMAKDMRAESINPSHVAYCWSCGHWLTSKPCTFRASDDGYRVVLAIHPEGKTLK